MARLDRSRLTAATATLAAAEPQLAKIVERFGVPPMWGRRPGFRTLVRIILEQQVSLASAAAVFARLEQTCDVTSAALAATPPARLRQCGITRQKADYCRGLAQAIESGSLDLRAVARAADEDARDMLCEIRGIGAWSADVYLLLALRRPDIWPGGDIALRTAFATLYELDRRPGSEELAALAARWSPWRSVAARLLWHYYLSRRREARQR